MGLPYKRVASVLLPCLVYVGLCVPFSDRAYDIDDPIFVGMARQIAKDPLRPLDFEIRWDGRWANAGSSANPPLAAYAWALSSAVFGESERTLHLTLVPFGLLAIWATGLLARRFGVSPFWARMLVATAPALIVTSNTVMPDVVLLALIAVGLAIGLSALDERRVGRLVVAALLLGASALVRYSGLGGLVLLLAYGVLNCVRLPLLGLAGLAGFAPLLAWNLLAYFTQGQPHLFAATGGSSWTGPVEIATHALISVALLSAVLLPPPLLALPWLANPRFRNTLFGLSGFLAFTLFMSFVTGHLKNPLMIAFYPLFFFGGTPFFLHCCANVARGASRLRGIPKAHLDDLILGLWVLGMLAAPLTYVHVAAKYFVPALPAMAIVFLRVLSTTAARRLLPFTAVLSAGVALAAAKGDYERAEVARSGAQALITPRLSSERTVFFMPEWGYNLYLERLGAKPLARDTKLRIGDILIATKLAAPRGIRSCLEAHMKLLERRAAYTNWPVVTMLPELNAGFHSRYWGWLPYSVGAPPIVVEELFVYELVSLPNPIDCLDGRTVEP